MFSPQTFTKSSQESSSLYQTSSRGSQGKVEKFLVNSLDAIILGQIILVKTDMSYISVVPIEV